MSENWLPIEGFTGYFISNLGNIYSARKGSMKLIQPEFTHNGYLRVRITGDNGKRYNKRIHLLVAEVWMWPRPEGYEIDHMNDVRYDNRVENLEWVSRKENLGRKRRRHAQFKRLQGRLNEV